MAIHNDPFTQEYCATEPRAENIRTLLLNLEHTAHATGWNGPDSQPRIFSVAAELDSPAVTEKWMDVLTEGLHYLAERLNGNVECALQQLATTTEYLRDNDMPLVGPAAGYTRPAPDKDMLGPPWPGWRFYGFGLRSEAWAAAYDPDGHAERLAREHRLSTYVGRQEVRSVWFVGRDGNMWTCVRSRGDAPHIIMFPPEGHPDVADGAGDIGNALSRMVNAAVPEPVHIR